MANPSTRSNSMRRPTSCRWTFRAAYLPLLLATCAAAFVLSAANPSSVWAVDDDANVKAPAAKPSDDKASDGKPPLSSEKRQELLSSLQKKADRLTREVEESPKSVELHSARGDARFFLAQFKEAVADYETMVELKPELETSHWRRGIAYFYAGRHKDAAKQFEIYHSFDDVDRENGIWRYFSQAKAVGFEKAREGLLKYKKDDREPFPAVYQLFSQKIKPNEILDVIAKADVDKDEREKRLFYAQLYIGLNEALEDRPDTALKHLREAVANTWGPVAGYGPTYMWHVGRVHFDLLTEQAAKKAEKKTAERKTGAVDPADDLIDAKPAAKKEPAAKPPASTSADSSAAPADAPKTVAQTPAAPAKIELTRSAKEESASVTVDGEARLKLHANPHKVLLLDVANNGHNIFVGQQAGQKTTAEGQYNVGIGAFTSYLNVTGKENTHVGFRAGSYGTGHRNSCYGSASGTHLGAGDDNSCFGYASGAHLYVGSRNTLIGSNAAGALGKGDENVVIGFAAGGLFNAGNGNVYIGDHSGYRNSQGGGNVFIGHHAGFRETESNRLYIANADNDAPLIYGRFDESFVGIGGTLGVRTDREKLATAVPAQGVLPRVVKLQPREYDASADPAAPRKKYALRSEEVEAEFPGLVTRPKAGVEGYIDYAGVTLLAVQAIREQQAQIDALKEQNARSLKMIEKLQTDRRDE